MIKEGNVPRRTLEHFAKYYNSTQRDPCLQLSHRRNFWKLSEQSIKDQMIILEPDAKH